MKARSALTPSSPDSAESDPGEALFRAKCSFCHEFDSNERKIGPGLAVVADGKLPSGKSANDENVLEQINRGGNGMPSFQTLLTDNEKAAVIGFLKHSEPGTSKTAETISSPSKESDAEPSLPTLDNRPTYQGLKPPVHELDTPGTAVPKISLPEGRLFIGQTMSDAMEILPAPEKEDTEDDPEIIITSPFGRDVGMRYVNRYRLSDGRTIIVRFQRDVPQRPFIGVAGTVHQPFVISSIIVRN